ncbi:MAG TPA: dienelactone hydrolase family protein [Rhizomicrobium sp.]|nr:dienelactone hydrolase family protein [Rhizomicrobium sp.]
MRGFPSRSFVAFPSSHPEPLTIAARLMAPATDKDRLPAVILLHGSAGPSAREAGYAEALNAAGFVTLEPDQWAPRGLAGGSDGRPKSFAETLPDIAGARAYLAARPDVRPDRIGLAGFSFGGVATMLLATRSHAERVGVTFAAYMPVYPALWTYNRVPGQDFRDLVDAPLFIITGGLDQYDDDPIAGERLVSSLAPQDRARIRTHVFPDAHHCFDVPGVDVVRNDPFSHRGHGGSVIMRCNPDAMAQSHRLAVAFFTEALA